MCKTRNEGFSRKPGTSVHVICHYVLCVWGLKGSDRVLQAGLEGQFFFFFFLPEAGPGSPGHPGWRRTSLCLLPDSHGR